MQGAELRIHNSLWGKRETQTFDKKTAEKFGDAKAQQPNSLPLCITAKTS